MTIKARRQNVMRSAKSKIIVAVSAFLFLLLLAPAAFSCTCPDTKHRADFRRAKAVFVGQAIDIDWKRGIPERFTIYSAKFKIEKAWKGSWKSEAEVPVFIRRTFSGCDGKFAFQPGEKYLVYLFEEKNELVA
ncbi:MAG TPA: hypothetical protein VKG02_09545, partial [Blastocatellia bacterium]|nr:hypothetical protein [Blastocatellia bacterium]